MNTNPDNTPARDDRVDRLVDGELGEQERREFLARLDQEPGGWRRCTLAFLEAQCWKETFGPIARQGTSSEPPPTTVRPARSPWSGRLQTVLAMAASFLLVFWVGSHLPHARPVSPVAGGGAPSQLASAHHPPLTPLHTVQDGGRFVQIGPPRPMSPSGLKTVAVSAPTGSSLRVPAVERNTIDPGWLQSLPAPMPEDVRQAFSRSGHEVQQHRELVPVQLNDGRRMVVPVDQVDVHYVGNGTY
jgi:hypothetical protein